MAEKKTDQGETSLFSPYKMGKFNLSHRFVELGFLQSSADRLNWRCKTIMDVCVVAGLC